VAAMKRKVTKKQHNSKMCFVCGLKNAAGLKASFYETDDHALVATFTPGEIHQSYPGRLHGGIASTILDETIGRAVMIGSNKEVWGVTLELTVEYKSPSLSELSCGWSAGLPNRTAAFSVVQGRYCFRTERWRCLPGESI